MIFGLTRNDVLTDVGILIVICGIYAVQRRKTYLYRKGVPGIAVVAGISETGINILKGENRYYPQFEITLSVKGMASESEPYRTSIRQTFMSQNCPYEVGNEVRVLIDPKNKLKMVITTLNNN